MKNLLTCGCCLFVANFISAQITFEKGYFVDNNNQKKRCYIKNEDWKNAPQQFEYRLTPTSKSQIRTVENTREFGVDSFSRYIQAEVLIETSVKFPVDKLPHHPALETKQIKTFLKVLVEGKAHLLYYESDRTRQFFAQLDTHAIEPLFYKPYLRNGHLMENAPFRHYLNQHLKGAWMTIQDFATLTYNQDALIALFEKYNKGFAPVATTHTLKRQKPQVNFKITVGLDHHDFEIREHSRFTSQTYPYQVSQEVQPTFGLEVEVMLPFHKNKWSLSVTPQFYFFNTYYNSKRANYKAIETPVHIRHYFFLNSNNKLFLSAGLNLNFPYAKEKLIQYNTTGFIVMPSTCLIMGVGYSFRRFGAQVRYYTPQELLSNTLSDVSNYRKLSLMLSYKL